MGRVELKIGAIEFSSEGEEAWVAEQLSFVSERIVDWANIAKATTKQASPSEQPSDEQDEPAPPLAKHLKDKNGDKSNTRKFLATADWLRRKGDKALTTKKVTEALRENQQKRLGNASQSLNDNVSQGLCEKDGSGFYITSEGLKSLGYPH